MQARRPALGCGLFSAATERQRRRVSDEIRSPRTRDAPVLLPVVRGEPERLSDVLPQWVESATYSASPVSTLISSSGFPRTALWKRRSSSTSAASAWLLTTITVEPGARAQRGERADERAQCAPKKVMLYISPYWRAKFSKVLTGVWSTRHEQEDLPGRRKRGEPRGRCQGRCLAAADRAGTGLEQVLPLL